jgi:hypothetical protein
MSDLSRHQGRGEGNEPVNRGTVPSTVDDLGADIFCGREKSANRRTADERLKASERIQRTFGPDERVRPEIRNAALRIDERYSIRCHHLDPRRSTTESRRVGLLGKVEIGEHDVAGFVKENVCKGGERNVSEPSSQCSISTFRRSNRKTVDRRRR